MSTIAKLAVGQKSPALTIGALAAKLQAVHKNIFSPEEGNMALFGVTLVCKDAYQRTCRRSFKFDDLNLAAAQANVALWVPVYQAITELQVVESRLTESVTYAGAPGANSNIDEGATFRAALDTPNKYASVQVPGIIAAARAANGVIDMTNASVIAWVAFYESGLVTASDGETVSTIESGILDK